MVRFIMALFGAAIGISAHILQFIVPLAGHQLEDESDVEYAARGVRRVSGIILVLGALLLTLAFLKGFGGGAWNFTVLLVMMGALGALMIYTLLFWAATAVPVAGVDVARDFNLDLSEAYIRVVRFALLVESLFTLYLMVVPVGRYPTWGIVWIVLTIALLLAIVNLPAEGTRGYGAVKWGVVTLVVFEVIMTPLFFLPHSWAHRTAEMYNCIDDPSRVECQAPNVLNLASLVENRERAAFTKGVLTSIHSFEDITLRWCAATPGSKEEVWLVDLADSVAVTSLQYDKVDDMRDKDRTAICSKPREQSSLKEKDIVDASGITSSATLTRSKEMIQWQVNAASFSSGTIAARMTTKDRVGFSVVERANEEIFFDLRINGQDDLTWECIEHLPQRIDDAYTWEVRLSDSTRTPGCPQSLPSGTVRLAQLYWKH